MLYVHPLSVLGYDRARSPSRRYVSQEEGARTILVRYDGRSLVRV